MALGSCWCTAPTCIGALVLLTLCAALGTKVLVRLRTAFSSPGHIAFATAIGAGILATELLVIAALAGPRAMADRLAAAGECDLGGT